MNKKRGGFSLVLVIILMFALGMTAALLLKMVYNGWAVACLNLQKEQAFYLAEAGLEMGKTEIARNGHWYSDLPHPAEDDADWLMHSAVGEECQFGEGSYKLVRESGKNYFYSVGKKNKAITVLKLSFSTSPLKWLGWKEL